MVAVSGGWVADRRIIRGERCFETSDVHLCRDISGRQESWGENEIETGNI